ncbi:MAG: DNA metabolism protein [Clostridiales bacterium]|nr:DNA metabolism protein [Clostridiales bacterium]
MPDRTDVKKWEDDVVYLYDGSFEGFLTCVFESFYRRELPLQITAGDAPESLLYRTSYIETDLVKAQRVLRSIPRKISSAAEEQVRLGFLTCREGKERLLLDFLRLGYRIGPNVTFMLQNETVHQLDRAVFHLTHEAHLLSGFIRFSIHHGVLVSIIGPKNFVLPLLVEHFTTRLPEENFLIYDEVHRAALIYRPHEFQLVPMDSFTLPEADREEAAYQNLWRRFYDTIAIEGRENPRCRMSLMPKRYWKYMTEFQKPGEGGLRLPGQKPRGALAEPE